MKEIPARYTAPSTDRDEKIRGMLRPFTDGLTALFRKYKPTSAAASPTGPQHLAWESFVTILLNQVVNLQLHPTEVLVLYEGFMQDAFFGAANTLRDFWNDDGVRKLVYSGVTLREYIHQNVRVFPNYDLQAMFGLFYPWPSHPLEAAHGAATGVVWGGWGCL